MTSGNHDDRLWEASRHTQETPQPTVGDDELIAYREGRLSAERERELERQLGDSARLRQRLANLAGFELPQPSAGLRKRVLGTKSNFYRWAVVAAALLIATLLMPVIWQQRQPDLHQRAVAALRSGVDFDIHVGALAELRSEGTSMRALPGSTVNVVMEQRGKAIAGLEFGLYRLAGNRLVRLDEHDHLTTTVTRGAVEWRTPATSLVEATPGLHAFYIAVAPQGALPQQLNLKAGAEPDRQLAAACHGQAYVSTLQILDPTQ